MAHLMSITVAFLLATTLVQAKQCSSGGECPSDDEPQNAMWLLQRDLQINGLKDGGGGGLGKMGGGGGAIGAHIASDSQAAEGSIKLIVNSDVRYSVALGTLFASMEKASFNRWNDVIVMRGSASEESEPFTPNTTYGQRGVTYIDIKLSSFDLHGLSGLYHHHHHRRVKANVYFYIHDTVLVNSTFPNKFDSMASTGEFEARHPPFSFNNMCVLGKGVVDAYGTYFDTPVTKYEGIYIEMGMGNVVGFAHKQTLLEESIKESYTVDLWQTGYRRTVKYFPSYGLTKYFLMDKYGDLTGDVKITSPFL